METYMIKVNGVTYEVEVEKKGEGSLQVAGSTGAPAKTEKPAVSQQKKPQEGQAVTAGTAGKVWKITAKEGDTLKRGDTILILEAMKMEIPIVASVDGTLVSLCVSEGDSVEAGQTVATVAR